jgi:hypothetical protein
VHYLSPQAESIGNIISKELEEVGDHESHSKISAKNAAMKEELKRLKRKVSEKNAQLKESKEVVGGLRTQVETLQQGGTIADIEESIALATQENPKEDTERAEE